MLEQRFRRGRGLSLQTSLDDIERSHCGAERAQDRGQRTGPEQDIHRYSLVKTVSVAPVAAATTLAASGSMMGRGEGWRAAREKESGVNDAESRHTRPIEELGWWRSDGPRHSDASFL